MNIYEMVTDRILASLHQGILPWKQPWSSFMPRNLVSNREYRGVNILLLQSSTFLSPYWLSFKQAKALGGTIKRGVHGCPVIYWNVQEKEQDDGTTRNTAFLRYSTVFNLQQTIGIEAPAAIERAPFNPIDKCEEVLTTYTNGPKVDHGGGQAYYLPTHDRVQLPHRGAFDRAEDYYCTQFHELCHSTGAAHRLSRKGVVNATRFASHAYSTEELIAEIGAAFLCSHAGIAPQTFDQSSAYISFWMAALINDHRMVIDASSQAAKAVDLILGRVAEKTDASEEVAA